MNASFETPLTILIVEDQTETGVVFRLYPS